MRRGLSGSPGYHAKGQKRGLFCRAVAKALAATFFLMRNAPKARQGMDTAHGCLWAFTFEKRGYVSGQFPYAGQIAHATAPHGNRVPAAHATSKGAASRDRPSAPFHPLPKTPTCMLPRTACHLLRLPWPGAWCRCWWFGRGGGGSPNVAVVAQVVDVSSKQRIVLQCAPMCQVPCVPAMG